MIEEKKRNVSRWTKSMSKIGQQIVDVKEKASVLLDELGKTLKYTLDAAFRNQQPSLDKALTALRRESEMITEMIQTLRVVKQHASDIDTFLSLEEFQSNLQAETSILEFVRVDPKHDNK